MFIFAPSPAEVNPTPIAVSVAEDSTSMLSIDADEFPDYSDEEWHALAEAAHADDVVSRGYPWL